MTRVASTIAVVLAVAVAGAAPARAAAARGGAVVRTHSIICKALGLATTLGGTLCNVAADPSRILRAGKKLVGGHLGSAVNTILGSGGGKAVAATVGLAAIAAWVSGGARAALEETARVIGSTTRPNLLSTWFSSSYWRVAAVSALLTLPFLFAAAIQALLRSDLALLMRAALGYLPLGMLAVGVAAPVTMLLLAASDEMSTIVSSASGQSGGTFLGHASGLLVGVSLAARSPFLAFFVGLLTVAAAMMLWLELLIREAAVYVIVLMLPLFFAALVWPARRIWAVRAVELLVALILSKFAIVAVLALGGDALAHAGPLGPTTLLAGLTLVLLAAFSPWALLRLLPMHEVASAAVGGLRTTPVQQVLTAGDGAGELSAGAAEQAEAMAKRMQDPSRAARIDSADDMRAPTPDRSRAAADGGGGGGVAVPDERVQTAGEQAASAVAASGGSPIGETAAPPATDADTVETDTAPSPDAAGGRYFTAPGAEGLKEPWHGPWRPIELGAGSDMHSHLGDPPPPEVDPPPAPDLDSHPPLDPEPTAPEAGEQDR